MKKHQLTAIIMSLVLGAGILAGCGSSDSGAATGQSASDAVSVSDTSDHAAVSSSAASQDTAGGQNSDNAVSADQNSPSSDDGSNTGTNSGGSGSLIVYFDYSENMGDTSGMDADAITSASLDGMQINGITENDLLVMRDEIQAQTGADVFSVRVNEPYDPDYNTMVGVAQEDQDNNKQFTFVEDLPDLSSYTTIYMGMPVWWGGLPQPMVCLLDQYDFSDKIIIPFGINLGSGFGRMIRQIEEAEPNAMVVEDGLTENAHTPNSEVRDDVDSWLANLNY